MAKRFLVVLAVLSLATAAFANGQNEKDQAGAFQGDKLTIKGTVSFQSGPHAILKSGDKQYLLMVPPYLVYNSGVKEGAQVAVQGYPLSYPPRMGWVSSNANLIGLFVTQATIDGKDYDLSRYYGQLMMGGRGPGFGPGGTWLRPRLRLRLRDDGRGLRLRHDGPRLRKRLRHDGPRRQWAWPRDDGLGRLGRPVSLVQTH